MEESGIVAKNCFACKSSDIKKLIVWRHQIISLWITAKQGNLTTVTAQLLDRAIFNHKPNIGTPLVPDITAKTTLSMS